MKLDQVKFDARLVRKPLTTGYNKHDDWHHSAFHWKCMINSVPFDFYTGSGLVDNFNQPKRPPLKDLVHSLLSEESACDQAFHHWCGDYGYETDSRKALETYLACQANGLKLRQTGICLEHARQELEDY